MGFNRDSKSKHRRSFSVGNLKLYLIFNKNNVIQATTQTNLGIILDTWLSFEKHLKTSLCKINETIGLTRKLQNLLPRLVLITLYKAFVRSHFMMNPTMHRFITN